MKFNGLKFWFFVLYFKIVFQILLNGFQIFRIFMDEAILIGVNRVFLDHYGGENELNGPQKDIQTMTNICTNLGVNPNILFGRNSVSNNVVNAISESARNASPGKMILIYYSGHGTQFPAGLDEEDGLNESWCLPDRCMIDNEINYLLSLYSEDVKVLLISDSCHSGTIPRKMKSTATFDFKEVYNEYNFSRNKEIANEDINRTYVNNKIFYDNIIKEFENNNPLKASILYLGACRDDQKAKDGIYNSVFTNALNSVWDYGNFSSDYISFMEQIENMTKGYNMNPVLFQYGVKDYEFLKQKPF